MKILLMEDEVKTIQSIKQGLEENGFEVDFCYDGLIGLHLCRRNEYNLIITDIIMPGMNGFDVCKELRREGNQTPVLMLSALGELQDKLVGFDAGADDYLTKPFAFQELLARIRALTKRFQQVHIGTNTIRFSDLEMDLDGKSVRRAGKLIELTAKEFLLLEFLLRNQGRVVSKNEISEKVWDLDFSSNTNVVEVYITLLRKKIDRDFDIKLLHNIYGMGYVIKTETV